MAKGDDAVRKKRNKINRKRMRNSESAVSARVASIIAAKRRRKAGKRRICEGMCYSLPTAEDPFNDRHGKKELPKKKKKPPPPPPPPPKKKIRKEKNPASPNPDKKVQAGSSAAVAVPAVKLGPKSGGDDYGCPSKFLILCLNAIRDSWMDEGWLDESADGSLLLSSTWGVDLWRCFSARSNVLDTSGACSSREQIAWLVSAASDIITRKEKQGLVVKCPFLLFLVPSQEKAIQVRSICKPLKALGIHTVSLHPGAPVDHQVRGLKSCEPEFVVSTPDRLLELVSLSAIDISGVSLLVVDGLHSFVDLNFVDKLNSIKVGISADPHIVIFSNTHGETSMSLARNLLGGPTTRLSLFDSIASQSAFLLQNVHFCASEEQKMTEVMQIVSETVSNQNLQSARILIIAESISKAQMLVSSLRGENCNLLCGLTSGCFTISDSDEEAKILVKDRESIPIVDVEQFEIVIIVDFPLTIGEYTEILTRTARHSVIGILHSFFCKVDAALARPLITVLEQCRQVVPEALRSLDSSQV
uniref:DEAD/DEAH-box helicase domain-containing protein n=1 Tax=Ananas comosus var. bracteatus TaxID=296719 RepID=A0A6V7QY72_ANACO